MRDVDRQRGDRSFLALGEDDAVRHDGQRIRGFEIVDDAHQGATGVAHLDFGAAEGQEQGAEVGKQRAARRRCDPRIAQKLARLQFSLQKQGMRETAGDDVAAGQNLLEFQP
ncbi:conserved hypothetical protein [Ricinus communis]|uniref:Uncharacterized protein n=1 Tax=Ricinus communis TaxID=3988 RepID=B9TFY4_RICCO|nr:conserved hypothetical protein [Ricinus communis]